MSSTFQMENIHEKDYWASLKLTLGTKTDQRKQYLLKKKKKQDFDIKSAIIGHLYDSSYVNTVH